MMERLPGTRRALVALVVALLLLSASCQGGSPLSGVDLVGTDLDGATAPDFRLTAHTGEPVTLSGLRGRVVALSFLYTSCPDTCPVTLNKFSRVLEILGDEADKAAFVAVSVDPERDSVERLRMFLDAQGLADRVLFLTGSQADLEQVWSAYHVAVSRPVEKEGVVTPYVINHTDATYLIDPAGRMRSLMRSDFAPQDLASSMRTLMAE